MYCDISSLCQFQFLTELSADSTYLYCMPISILYPLTFIIVTIMATCWNISEARLHFVKFGQNKMYEIDLKYHCFVCLSSFHYLLNLNPMP